MVISFVPTLIQGARDGDTATANLDPASDIRR